MSVNYIILVGEEKKNKPNSDQSQFSKIKELTYRYLIL